MIAVIIIKKNGSYGVLEVEENGKLYIQDPHLICGCTQNGVKMTMYGENTPLLPFEVYIHNETLSLSIVGNELYHPGHRFLDFSSIELLQTQNTFHPSQSGSSTPFEPPVFLEGGYAINYNLIIGGLNIADPEEAQLFFRNGDGNGSNGVGGSICNALINLEDGYQHFSTHFYDHLGRYFFRGQTSGSVTALIDRDGVIKTYSDNVFHTCNQLETIILSGIKVANVDPIYFQMTSLKLFELTNLESFNPDPSVVSSVFNKIPDFVEIRVPRSFETNNGGNMDATLQQAVTNKNAIITYLD